jgi:hypothetical protein
MRTRTLVMTGLVAAIVIPVVSQFLRPVLPVPSGENLTFGYLFSDPLGMFSELLFTGEYPVLPWMAYFCAGIVVGRLTLSSARVAWHLLVCGASLGLAAYTAAWVLLGPLGGSEVLRSAGAGDLGIVDDLLVFGFDGTTPTTSWWWLATGAPHAGTPFDLLGTIGCAVALLGAMLLLGHVERPILRRVIDVAAAPLAAAGAMTLTLYTAHVVFMNSPLEVFTPTTAYAIQVSAVLLFATIWRKTVGRGPLEAAVSTIGARARALATGRKATAIREAGSAGATSLETPITPEGSVSSRVPMIDQPATDAPLDEPSEKGPTGRPLHIRGPIPVRQLPTRASRRLPGPIVARPPDKPSGTHHRPNTNRP